MRISLLSTALLLVLSACASSPEDAGTTGGADAAAAANLDVCSYLTKEVADLILGGAARDPSPNFGNDKVGGCTWSGADEFAEQLQLSVSRNGTSAAYFAEGCAARVPPAPSIDSRGIGVAACGRANADGGATLMIQLDAGTTNLTLISTVGTLDQAFEVLREVDARLPPP